MDAADKMLDVYIHDYLVKKKYTDSAKSFQREAQLPTNSNAIGAPGCFLSDWWSEFRDVFIERYKGSEANHEMSAILAGQSSEANNTSTDNQWNFLNDDLSSMVPVQQLQKSNYSQEHSVQSISLGALSENSNYRPQLPETTDATSTLGDVLILNSSRDHDQASAQTLKEKKLPMPSGGSARIVGTSEPIAPAHNSTPSTNITNDIISLPALHSDDKFSEEVRRRSRGLVIAFIKDDKNIVMSWDSRCFTINSASGVISSGDCVDKVQEVHRTLFIGHSGPSDYTDQAIKFLKRKAHKYEQTKGMRMMAWEAKDCLYNYMCRTAPYQLEDPGSAEFLLTGWDSKGPQIFRMDRFDWKSEPISAIGSGAPAFLSMCKSVPRLCTISKDEGKLKTMMVELFNGVANEDVWTGNTVTVFHVGPEGGRPVHTRVHIKTLCPGYLENKQQQDDDDDGAETSHPGES